MITIKYVSSSIASNLLSAISVNYIYKTSWFGEDHWELPVDFWLDYANADANA